MGFLADLKKNLGFAEKDGQKHGEPQAPAGVRAEPQDDSQAEVQAAAGLNTGAGGSSAAAAAAARAEPAAQAAPAPAAAATEVVVESGDTLSGIAVQFGVDLNALIAVNAENVPNPELIYPGQVLCLP